MPATMWSTESDFENATLSNTVSYLGVMRFGAYGSELIDSADWTVISGTWVWGQSMVVQTLGTNVALTLNGTSSLTDATIRARLIRHENDVSNARIGLIGRAANDSNYYVGMFYEGDLIKLFKKVATVYTELASTAAAHANSDKIDARLAMTGTTITFYDDTLAVNVSATDSALASGSVGLFSHSTGGWGEALRVDSTATSGSVSLPTSTTYVDLGSAKLMGSVSWDETLDNGDVTVDVYGSDNGTSDAAGASVTGLTDPAGSDCSAAGSHRYWRVVVNFTRTLTTQEPTVSRIALNQTAAPSGGAGRSRFAGAGMRVS